ncbi:MULTISPECIES: SseB family protein [unclassified Meridianimarinicoccus]|uniref:SseB family protein n=1 Tax=unclassified Meridianimarinicoccus TaxID=2923344 RepID=UPI0018665004|nr:SseB family protein [Fluviibacterium sp. MJW13]
MTPLTPLDHAHAAMAAAPDDDALRLRFFERLADAELFLLLEREARDETVDPQIFETDDGKFLLAFDLEERLAGFAEGTMPYLALSGRTLIAMIAQQGVGLGLNLGTAPSETLLPPEAVDWLAETLAHAPEEAEDRPRELAPPKGLPESLLTALDGKLALMTGRARLAYLCAVTYESGRRSHLLAFVDTTEGAETALARAVNEALAFSGLEAGALDVAFFAASDAIAARLARTGLRFDLPQPDPQDPSRRPAPGSDPTAPPILR